ncbi:agouti-related protein-like [Clarias gariepinus]|uniref:agouti-related protein-like n=1 Tax=Clarias gariepinus TaxID=13013 RepID=UPI00234DFE0C|nr:agouti-related protein-like [Clarias gariepinus]
MKLIVLCVVFVRVHVALFVAEEEKQATPAHFTSHQTDLGNHEKPPNAVVPATGGVSRLTSKKPLADLVLKAPRCSRLKESCTPDSHSRCCDPCASCHCRLFNTICRCWKLGHHCQKKP